jgi:hypothetical protein
MPCESENTDVLQEHIATLRDRRFGGTHRHFEGEEVQARNQWEAGVKQSTSNLGRVIDNPVWGAYGFPLSPIRAIASRPYLLCDVSG